MKFTLTELLCILLLIGLGAFYMWGNFAKFEDQGLAQDSKAASAAATTDTPVQVWLASDTPRDTVTYGWQRLAMWQLQNHAQTDVRLQSVTVRIKSSHSEDFVRMGVVFNGGNTIDDWGPFSSDTTIMNMTLPPDDGYLTPEVSRQLELFAEIQPVALFDPGWYAQASLIGLQTDPPGAVSGLPVDGFTLHLQ
ncbi:hypothetical protein HY933_03505 [Candidatus Falkowbacteria bacterium]|nr:hypothetical protein [Candidatus Falkowbacteria bacterium]